MIRIGETVKNARVKRGLSQKKFAESLTVSQPYISAVENGKEIPTPMFLRLFSLLYPTDENNNNHH